MSSSTPPKGAPMQSRALVTTLILGAASTGLYFLLFAYADELIALAKATRDGNKLYALVPIVVAMVFSFVHGAFTGQFWDLLGLRAKK
jgi:hypothetical protein